MRELSYLEAIREALQEEMRRDPKVFVLGEDVGAYGGAFGVTQGLYDEFGDMRVVDTPISESAIVGISIGASLRGYRPVAEMQFADFISCGFDQIVNQAATLRYRYGGRAPLETGRRGRGDRSSHAEPVRQGRDFPVARQDEPRARRARGCQDTRPRRGALRRHHGGKIRRAGRTCDAGHLP